jgi:hypothetical protein
MMAERIQGMNACCVLLGVLLLTITGVSCVSTPNLQQKTAAHGPNEVHRFLAAVDRTLRNQIQAFSIPVVVELTPVSVTASIAPTITYRAPGAGQAGGLPITVIAKSNPTPTPASK